MRQRFTIKSEVTFTGVGLHSGCPATLHLVPSDSGCIRVCTSTGKYALSTARIVEAQRMTALQLPDGQYIKTIEHLLAALYALNVDDVDIYLDGEELPILDGSALPYFETLSAAGFSPTGKTLVTYHLANPVGLSDGARAIVALPSQTLRVSYTIDYTGTPLATEFVSLDITPETFACELAPARTFCLEKEIQALKKAGLAQGGSLDNALVIGEKGIINELGLRIERECVRHKVVDLLGDLALIEKKICAHYVVTCGGHALHARLVDRMRALFP